MVYSHFKEVSKQHTHNCVTRLDYLLFMTTKHQSRIRLTPTDLREWRDQSTGITLLPFQ